MSYLIWFIFGTGNVTFLATNCAFILNTIVVKHHFEDDFRNELSYLTILYPISTEYYFAIHIVTNFCALTHISVDSKQTRRDFDAKASSRRIENDFIIYFEMKY
jgi:hypothetical protein